MYALGVDLGTVYTAAATWRDGHAEIVSLGSRSATIPSVVLLREDASFLTGEAANRRALTEPGRVAREFKRRFGDSTPIMLGGTPHSPEALMSRLLRSVVQEVSAQQGEPPVALCVCHPANWGPYKTDLLQQAIRMADLDVPTTLSVEPVAAAAYYARQQRVEDGALVAVYDLGGGTFDSAVVRTTDGSFEIIGRPEGIEHLGGADFDAAVFEYVRSVVGEPLTGLDDSLSSTVAAVARLREECTSGKETLSSDTDTTIPVLLPHHATEVRLTRGELESMVRPSLYDTISALQRAIRSAGVTAADLHSVLLIGGSSRIPLVAQLVGAEVDRPVAVDAHPKHAVALGAAWIAGGAHAGSTGAGNLGGTRATVPAAAAGPEPARPEPVRPEPVRPEPARPEPDGRAATTSDAGQPAVWPPPQPFAAAAGNQPGGPAGGPPPGGIILYPPAPNPPAPNPAWPAPAPAPGAGPQPGSWDGAAPPLPPPPSPAAGPSWWSRPWVVTVAAAVVVLLVVAPIAWLIGQRLGSSGSRAAALPPSVSGTSGGATRPNSSTTKNPSNTSPAKLRDLIYTCPTGADSAVWACLKSARASGGKLYLTYTTNFSLSPIQDAAHYHFHLYLADPGPNGTTDPPDRIMQHVPDAGSWFIIYSGAVTTIDDATERGGKQLPLDVSNYQLFCVRVASGLHGLAIDRKGGYRTGNCVRMTTG